MIDKEEYNKMFEMVTSGDITQQEWYEYCTRVLVQLMEDNK